MGKLISDGMNLIRGYMWPFKKRQPEVLAEGVRESWSMFQGEYDGKPLIARVTNSSRPS